MVEYHVDTLPQFQYIVDESGEKGKFGGWLRIRMNLVEHPVIFLVQDEAIFKQYIFTNKLQTYKVKCWPVPKDKGYGIVIPAFQYK